MEQALLGIPISPEDYERLKKHAIALENGRADLWGVNQELREKIRALENGQVDLLAQFREVFEAADRLLVAIKEHGTGSVRYDEELQRLTKIVQPLKTYYR